jgi:hypothetical protein
MVKVRFEYWPVVWFWPLSLVAMQVTVGRLGDFEVTWAVIACHLLQIHLLLFYWLRRPSDRQVLLGLGIVAYALIVGLAAADAAEFWKSLAHVTNLLAMLAICANVRLGSGDEVARSVGVFAVLATAVGLVIIAQALSFNLWGDFALARPLGPFAPLGPGFEVYVPQPGSPLPRANGLYSEPSVAGWFMLFAAALALASRRLHPKKATVAAGVCLLAAMATLSLTGILGAAIMSAAYLVFVRDRLGFKLAWLALAGSMVVLALLLAYDLGILGRLRYLETPGTSIYFRLNAPTRLIADTFGHHPFGYPLGQTDFIAGRHYYINWKLGSQTNIDNTLLLIVFYFGVVGVLINLAYLLALLRLLVVRRHAFGVVMLSLTIAFVTTGAGWAHHFALLLGYAVIVGRCLAAEPSPALQRPVTGPLTRLPRVFCPDPETPAAARLRAAWRLAGGAA